MSSAEQPTVAPSALLYLFGGEVVPKAARFAGMPAAEVVCSEERVRKDAFAEMLWAIAFWGLHDRGLVRLRVEKDAAGAATAQVAPVAPAELPGLEGSIVTRLHGHPVAEKRAKFLVFSWLPGPVKDPHGATIDDVAQAAGAEGYLEAVVRGGRVKRVKPDCERIATLRPAFEAVSERWMTFRRADPELDRALFDAIALGLAERIPKKSPIEYDPLSWYP